MEKYQLEEKTCSQRAEQILRDIRSIRGRFYYLMELEADKSSSEKIVKTRVILISQLAQLAVLSERGDLYQLLHSISKKLDKKSESTGIREGYISPDFITKIPVLQRGKSGVFFVLELLKNFYMPTDTIEAIIIKDTLGKVRQTSSDVVSDS